MNSSVKDYLQLHFIVLLWGFTAILGVLISIPAVEIVFYRTLLASLALAALLAYRKRNFRLGKGALLKMLLTGSLIAGHWVLFFAAARIATVSVCLAGMATATLWTSILEPMVTKRGIKAYEVALGLVIIGGLYVIFQFEFDHALGLTMAIFSAFLASCFTVINGEFTKKHNGYMVTFYEMVGACLTVAVLFPLYRSLFPSEGQGLIVPSPMDWMWIAILALICTVYAYSASVELQKRLSAFSVNLCVNLEPVYGILLAVLIFNEDEKMTLGFYAGTAIILLAVLVYPLFVRWDKRRQLRIRKIQ
ncbi:DMT family transporter [Nafulsella turpanensis]|uniref:DMT family transporter n=1 Tax=Nafulsella turpanensis TaxID=1265690 RepID=UPI00034B5B1E|nr:DMT family transporter [Nafulsella turpanensis]